MKRAQLVFDMLVERRITPDVITYTMMINGYCRVNCLRKARDIFSDMKERGIKPDVIAYTIVFDAHSKVNLKMARSLQFFKGKRGRKFGVTEDMSKEDIAANRAIGLYGVSFLQSHIKYSNSLRSLTHCNTRSLVTTAKFHLIHYNLLAYRISRGSIQLIDLRQSAVYDHKAEVLQHDESSGLKFFFFIEIPIFFGFQTSVC